MRSKRQSVRYPSDGLSEKQPFVSVIVPNYNHASFLDDRIGSILKQTYPGYEIIILDDNSTDDSLSVINKYRSDPHVSAVLCNEINSGSPFLQWHKGMDKAKGDLIWIAESDDSCARDMLSLLVNEFCKDEKCVLAFCRSALMNSDGICTGNHKNQHDLHGSFHMGGKLFIMRYLRWRNVVVNASSAVFRKDTAMSVDRHYASYKGVGDWLFWIELSEKGNVAFVNAKKNFFRQHASNTTSILASNGKASEETGHVREYLLSSGYLSKIELFGIHVNDVYHAVYDGGADVRDFGIAVRVMVFLKRMARRIFK
ncbi:MAG: glycosyltransferase [Bacteroidales bacterium]|jgi:glycosyltransferase involved in cell wall biosynthesis|nr:glycosyltransferase [Bacteroidales bacterium]MCI1785045.1 glycosyltransferase [Bacteroidales bacterium]